MEIVASTSESTVVVWDILSGDIITTLSSDASENVCCISFSPCGSILAAGTENGAIVLWDCNSWTKRCDLVGHTRIICCVCFDRVGEKVLSVSDDSTARVWDVSTNEEVLRISTSESFYSPAGAFNHSGDGLAIVFDRDIFCFDAYSGAFIKKLSAHESTVTSLQFSPDGSMLLSASNDRSILLWDVASGDVLRVLRGHTKGVTQVCFNADASRIVSCSPDKTTRIWDVSTGECALTLTDHIGNVRSCCFSEDGSKVITASDDATVTVWDSYTGEELRTLISLTGGVRTRNSVAYRPSPSGSYI